MTDQDKRTAALLLEWSRTIVDHRLSWEEWVVRRAAQTRRFPAGINRTGPNQLFPGLSAKIIERSNR